MSHTRVFILVCLLWLCPFLITSFFNQPAIDDYWNAGAINESGRWGAVKYFYHTVSARYVSLSVMSLCNTLPQHEVWIFKAWPLITVLLLFACVYFLYASLFDEKTPKRETAALALLCVVVHIAGMRSLFEGLYWMSSAVCYQLSVAVFAVAVGAILRDIKSPRRVLKITAVIASCLLTGTVEIIMPVYLFVLVCLLFLSFKRGFDKTLTLCCLAVSLLFSFLLFKSGANQSRIESNKGFYDPTWQKAVYLGLQSCAYYLAFWLTNPLIISSVVLMMTSRLRLSKQFSIAFTPKGYLVLFIFTVLIGLAVYFPLHLFESSLPFPRITTLFFFFFLQVWVIVSTSAFSPNSLHTFFEKYVKQHSHAKPIAASLFFLFAFTNNNFLSVSEDLLNGNTARYNAESAERYHIIRNCTGDSCYIPPYTAWPYFAQSAGKEPTEPGSFQHMNEYFKKTILLRKE